MMLNTPEEVIDALGGNQPVAELFGVGSSAVSNYKKTGFPAWLLLRLASECEARGLSLNPSLLEARKPARRADPATPAPAEAAQ